MSIETFDPEILQDFLTESGELLEQLEVDLVEIENRADDKELLNQIFRALHTIKGSASFLALTNLVEIAHVAESALNAARNGDIRVNAYVMDLLLRAVDVLKVQFRELSGGSTNLTKAEEDLVRGLARVAEGDTGPGANAAAPAASATPPAAAAPGPPNPSTDTAALRRPLALDSSKSDLLEHFVADLDGQFASIGELLGELAQQTERDAAAHRLDALGDELRKTVGFFQHEPMLRLTEALLSAGHAATQVQAETFEQMLARMGGVLALLREQADGLREQVIVDRPCENLLRRLESLAAGAAPDHAWTVSGPHAADEVLRVDGVMPGATAPAMVTPAPVAVEAPANTVSLAPSTNAPSAPAPVADEPAPGAKPAATNEAAAKDRGAAAAPQGEQTIRVDVTRLDTLMNLVGELVLQKNRIGELMRRIARETKAETELREQTELAGVALDRVTSDIQTAVMRTRMQPLEKLFGKYPRLIRDLATKTGKKIQLVIEGGETEVDRSVIEELGDPLIHLMRNSADHGLEPPAERLAAGKSEAGTIRLQAAQEGDHVCIRIGDDGRGLIRARIAKKAIERGLATEAEIAQLSDLKVARFIFLPGFSTAEKVSDLSGRGVGLDVVRTNIEKLKGTVDLQTTPGAGTTFIITIPLTVAIMPAMMVEVSGETFAVPLGSLAEIVKPTEGQLGTIVKERVLRVRGAVLPLLDACDVFDVPNARREEGRLALVLTWGDREMALLVTRVIGQQEIVIKPLEGVERTGPVSGATVRNDGGVSLIIDVAELFRSGAGDSAQASQRA